MRYEIVRETTGPGRTRLSVYVEGDLKFIGSSMSQASEFLEAYDWVSSVNEEMEGQQVLPVIETRGR